MPLTFAQAYAIVCPDGREVVPNSQDFNDIIELMKQSGHVSFQDKLVVDLQPRIPTTVQEARPFIARQNIEAPNIVSKRQWLSIQANRNLFINSLNKK